MAQSNPPETPSLPTSGGSAVALRKHVEQRLSGLRNARTQWWAHWGELGTFILPRRNRWLVSPNARRGGEINNQIVRSTATRAARICASGMMAGITSPSRPWFRLALPGVSMDDSNPVRIWLDCVTKQMMAVFAASNYYTSKASQFQDLCVFGTAPLLIYEDFEDVIRCYNPMAGEYFAGNSRRFQIDHLFREFTWNVTQIVSEFGLDACSEDVKGVFRAGGAGLAREWTICHAIEPNDERLGGSSVPKVFPYREVYWLQGSQQTELLRVKGFHEAPFSCPRWDLAGNDAYGRSPGMDALGAAKQLQMMIKRQAQVVDKIANPPLTADISMKNEPASMLPGGITYVAGGSGGVGIKPTYQVPPGAVGPISEIIKDVEAEINESFYTDLFLMISQLDTVRTATEIDARREEKLIQLGPVLERFQNESLKPDIDRTFAIMARASMGAWSQGQDGVLPMPPPEVRGMDLEVSYVSMLAEAQSAASTTAIERLAAFVGNLNAVDPNAIDNIDIDQAIDEYAEALGVPSKVMRATVDVAAIRQKKAQAQQQQAAVQNSTAAVQGAQTLSQTNVGGGQNALQMMLGNSDLPQAQAA